MTGEMNLHKCVIKENLQYFVYLLTRIFCHKTNILLCPLFLLNCMLQILTYFRSNAPISVIPRCTPGSPLAISQLSAVISALRVISRCSSFVKLVWSSPRGQPFSARCTTTAAHCLVAWLSFPEVLNTWLVLVHRQLAEIYPWNLAQFTHHYY